MSKFEGSVYRVLLDEAVTIDFSTKLDSYCKKAFNVLMPLMLTDNLFFGREFYE
jgi:hypothetical protein